LQPDVALVLHAWRCAAACRTLFRVQGLPVVVSMRGTDLNEMLGQGERGAQIAQTLTAAAAIVVFHEPARQRLAAADPVWAGKTHVIPNGVELPASAIDYRARLALPRAATVFVAVSGLRDVKRPLWPVPLLARLRAAGRDLFWLHAGPPLDAGFAEQLDALRREHAWLRHVDQVPHAEIGSFLSAGDVFVSASRSEGMPHAVREAMLTGRALLLSDIEGHRNMAAGDREALFFTDEDSFLLQAERLLADAALRQRLGDAAQQRVRADLCRDDETQAHLNLFRQLRAQVRGDTP
jgi:glycosyltransferase involved in cell wall biosynthesis